LSFDEDAAFSFGLCVWMQSGYNEFSHSQNPMDEGFLTQPVGVGQGAFLALHGGLQTAD